MPRPKYKGLYLYERAKAKEFEEDRKDLRNELSRIRAMLATEGQPIIDELLKLNKKEFQLAPLPYECVLACLRANMRYTPSDVADAHGYQTPMRIKGVPVILR